MIYDFCFSNGDRRKVIEFLSKNKYERVLDVGYSASGWDSEFVTHYIDVVKIDSNKKSFIGDINCPDVWEGVSDDVNRNGKFDFCICSHTLEDIVNPLFVSKMINKFCSSGFVAVPSKFIEMTRNIDGPFRGYIHHRYIYNFEGEKLVGYPKLNFIENDQKFDALSFQLNDRNKEIQFFWKDSFEVEIVNNNYMGPNVSSVVNCYNNLFK